MCFGERTETIASPSKKQLMKLVLQLLENTRKTWNTDFIIVCQNLIGLYS